MKKKSIFSVAPVALMFILLVFCILVVTMAIVGVVIYWTFKREIFRFSDFEYAWSIVITFLIASVIIGTVISGIAAKIVLKNMDNVVKGMEDLTNGNYGVRIHETGKGMGKELIDSFNLLATELDNTQVLRSDFVNDFAHEFKTPIVSLLGFAKILKNEDITAEQRKEYLSIIEEEAERLSEMSTNSLNFTKIDKQSILTDETRYNLSEQIRICVLLLEKKWAKREIEPVLDFDEYYICANEEMLKQVWINLIDNAIKFSYEGEQIEIGIKEITDGVSVWVKDKGADIKEEEKKKIFNRFYRSEVSKGIEGTGVGLAIVKKIVDLHKGSITVNSEDGITCFEVNLPNNIGDE